MPISSLLSLFDTLYWMIGRILMFLLDLICFLYTGRDFDSFMKATRLREDECERSKEERAQRQEEFARKEEEREKKWKIHELQKQQEDLKFEMWRQQLEDQLEDEMLRQQQEDEIRIMNDRRYFEDLERRIERLERSYDENEVGETDEHEQSVNETFKRLTELQQSVAELQQQSKHTEVSLCAIELRAAAEHGTQSSFS